MQGRTARRWMAMLLVHPLMATVSAVDLAWIVLGHRQWQAAAYTVGVLAVAVALAACTHRVARLPRVASVVTLFLAVILTNAALMMSGVVLVRLGWELPTVAVACLGTAVTAVVLTALVGATAEAAARRAARPVEHHESPVAGTFDPLPTPDELMNSTLVDPSAPTAVRTLEPTLLA
jgi:hypothetical protein